MERKMFCITTVTWECCPLECHSNPEMWNLGAGVAPMMTVLWISHLSLPSISLQRDDIYTAAARTGQASSTCMMDISIQELYEWTLTSTPAFYFLFQLMTLHFNHWLLRSQPSMTWFPSVISILITQESWSFQFDPDRPSYLSPITPWKKIKTF